MYLSYNTGHFPWLMNLFKGIFSYTEMGKAMNYVSKVALDLIKVRRQSGHKENVRIMVTLVRLGIGSCVYIATCGINFFFYFAEAFVKRFMFPSIS